MRTPRFLHAPLWALLSLAPAAPAQSPDEPPAPAEQPAEQPVVRGQLLNGVQLIVNNDCITSTDLLSLASRQSGGNVDPSQLRRLMTEGANELARTMLMRQAGKDMGYDPGLVDAMVREELSKKKSTFGSITALAELFDEARMDSATFKENTENDIYTILWRRSVSGLYIGPGGRQYVDRYIRPGQLELEFKRLGKSLDLPRKVRLQEIIIASQVGEELSGARQRAMLVRSRARRGEDFEALNVEFGVPTREVDGVPTYGVDLDPIEEAKLPARSDIFAFVQSAQPGDVSEPLPAANASGVIGGFRLLRLVERIEGAAKSFQEREFQGQLRDAQVERRENFLVERGLARLMSAAYIWPPEVSPRSELPPPPGAQGDPAQPGQPEVQPESAEAPVPAGEVPAEAQAEDPAEAPVEAPVEEPAEKPAEGAPQAPEQPPANGGTGGGR